MLQAVGARVTLRRRHGILALVQPVNVRRPRPGRVQRETAGKTKTIQNLPAFGKRRDPLIVSLLIEIQTGFVPARDIQRRI